MTSTARVQRGRRTSQVAPHNVDLERQLLAAAMSTFGDADRIAGGLDADDFYVAGHRVVWIHIAKLVAEGVVPEASIVQARLERAGELDQVGGPAALVEIMGSEPVGANVDAYVAELKNLAWRRDGQAAAAEVARAFRDGDDPTPAILRLSEVGTGPDADRATATTGLPGGDWVLDAPPGVPAVWGHGGDVLWAEGEPMLLVGPAGAGKTTIAGQILWGRLGLLDRVLGYPIAPTSSRTLYLAMDRPRQIQRALGRLARPHQRDVLNERLVVHRGPPPKDLARHPEVLAYMAAQHGADTVFIDSLKDAAVGLSDDEVGAGLNRAIQTAVAEGIEVASLHHQRKGQNGAKPKQLEDVYGSTWITAGAGSVVLLWGEAGDELVELSHLKPAADKVGPVKVAHNHETGISTLEDTFDLLSYLRRSDGPVTAPSAATAKLNREPTENEVRTVRRALDRLTKQGHARKIAAVEGGATGTQPARWCAVDSRHGEPQ